MAETPPKSTKTLPGPEFIRNVCILAHVDHGKTTIADLLVASNGYISNRIAGNVRYLDDRKDEQERGITMKSSAISLSYISQGNDKYIVNLVDTPGHIDFSTEVSAAVRICDGAIIVVDIIEGVCVQTKESIKQAFNERVKMVLIVNKFDRIFVEQQKSVDDIYQILLRIIEDCNSYIAQLFVYDVSCTMTEEDYMFSPVNGNVIFGSAIDGWGVTTENIVSMFSHKLPDCTNKEINEGMWNPDLYVSKGKIAKGALVKGKPNLFVSMFLNTMNYIYYHLRVRQDQTKYALIKDKLHILHETFDMRHLDTKVQVKAILQAWRPMAVTIFEAIKGIIPPPSKHHKDRYKYLINTKQYFGDTLLMKQSEEMVDALTASSKTHEYTYVYVSKMFPVNKTILDEKKAAHTLPQPRNQKKREATTEVASSSVPSDQDNAGQKEEETPNQHTKDEIEIMAKLMESLTVGAEQLTEAENKVQQKTSTLTVAVEEPCTQSGQEDRQTMASKATLNMSSYEIIGLARVFSGVIRTQQKMYVLHPGYRPPSKDFHDLQNFIDTCNEITEVVIESLYILLGRDLIKTESVSAGNICGILGLKNKMGRMGTLSSTPLGLPLNEQVSFQPVIRNAIECKNPGDIPLLKEGLKFLKQIDSCVQVIVEETGEFVLITAGDVHLAKCIEDITTIVSNVYLNVSEPMVSLKETVNSITGKIDFTMNNLQTAQLNIADIGLTIALSVIPLPDKVVNKIQQNFEDLRLIEEFDLSKPFADEALMRRVAYSLDAAFELEPEWSKKFMQIWSVGKNKENINILFNMTNEYNHNIFEPVDRKDPRTVLDHLIVNGFDMACRAGPICEEPVANCAFIIGNYELLKPEALENAVTKMQVSCNLPTLLRERFREAMKKQIPRLMEPMFLATIQVTTRIVGKVYKIVNRHHGKVTESLGMDEDEKIFMVKAEIPVLESYNLANEFRGDTSGNANVVLKFNGYQVLEGDPFYKEVEEEENEDENGDNIADSRRASQICNAVRKRKGLKIDNQVIVHAEKQRTLNKKK